MTNKLVVIINSLKVPKIKKLLLWNEISCTKLQLPPEPLTRGLPPTDPRSLCPQPNLLNPPPPYEQNSWVRHCELYVDECRNVSFVYISVSTIRENVDGVTESTKSGTKLFCDDAATVLSEWIVPRATGVSYLFIALEITIGHQRTVHRDIFL